jgi:septal ring factor EnvC (AmiA/AmiB activator)
MTGFKDRIKDALSDFVEFDESAPASPDGKTPGVPRRADPVGSAAPRSGAAPDPSFRTLYAAMDSVPDERLRYDVALKALRASHQIGPDAVLASIEDRIRLLDAERTKFEQALAAETERSINGTNRQIKSIADSIAAKQTEIRDLEAKQATLYETAKVAQSELDRSRASFAAAFASVHSSLDAERARIATHLSSGK